MSGKPIEREKYILGIKKKIILVNENDQERV